MVQYKLEKIFLNILKIATFMSNSLLKENIQK